MRHFLRTIAVAFLLVTSSLANAAPYSAIYVFGDSLSDGGNNAAAFDAANAPLPPGTVRTPAPFVGQGFIPSAPYASNRYSNGPVFVEYLAAALGNPLTPSLLGGTNYAYGGATTGPLNPAAFPPSLLSQVAAFIAAPGPAPSTALYVIAGGGNDARAVLNGLADAATTVAGYAANIGSIIASLYAEGARNFLIMNTPDVGKTPALQAAGPAAAGLASGLTFNMNAALTAQLASMSASITAGVRVLDAWTLTNAAFANPALFGMTNSTLACGTSPACIASPDGTFFWDGIHPTTAGHMVLAQAGLRALPEPGTIALLLVIGVVGFAIRARA